MLQQETARVADHMTSDPVTMENTASLKEAVGVMTERRIGNLIVSNGAMIGLLTEREILNYLHTFGTIPDKSLADVELRTFTKVSPETTILDAAKTMLEKKTRLLVYKDDHLVGILTTSDLAKALFKTSKEDPSLDRVMSRNPASLETRASVLEAIKVMNKRRIGSVIVTSEGLHDGIFTERDLLTKILTQNVNLSEEIGSYVSPFLVTGRIGVSSREVLGVMIANRIKRLPLTNNGRIVGIVTARDVVEAYVPTIDATSPKGCDPIC